MRIRAIPSLKGKVLATVSSPDRVVFQGAVSANTDEVILRDKTYNSHWYKVRNESGTIGWIYGAAIGKN